MHKRKLSYSDLFSKKQALKASFAISFLINLILILGILFGQTRSIGVFEGVRWPDYMKYFFWHFGCNIVLFYLLFLFNFRIIRSRGRERIRLLTSLGTLFICFLVSPILSQIQWYAVSGEKGMAADNFIVFNLIKDIILAIVIVLVTQNIYVSYKREQAIIANQKLKEENIRMQFEALKNQLDPHFLFNSLNTLNGLIGIDDEKAHDYVDNLSSVFRYTLRNKYILTLDEELDYVRSYVSLLKIRYGNNLRIEYEIDNRFRQYHIMPISIQLLVENAVKHNVISNQSPLLIRIQTTPNESIVVANRIQPKTEKSLGGGVGLANLTDRYSILFKKEITISDENDLFSVEIPLIKEENKNKRYESNHY